MVKLDSLPQRAQLGKECKPCTGQAVHDAAVLWLRGGALRLLPGRQPHKDLRTLLQRGDVTQTQHSVLVIGLYKVAVLQKLGQQPVQRIARQRLQGAVAFQARCAKLPQAARFAPCSVPNTTALPNRPRSSATQLIIRLAASVRSACS